MPRLHLLLGGHAATEATPRLAKLLARGHAEHLPSPLGRSAALAGLFGLGVRDLPALAFAGEGGEPGDAAWFGADPVHLLAGMHSVTLFDSRQFRIGAEEAGALTAALNHHFASEVEFMAPHPTRWYARFRHAPAVETPPTDEVAGGPVGLGLIAGPDARNLQRVAMEIQMLLHDHPVNAAREARGEPSLNGVWFWGGGGWRRPAAAFDAVVAEDFLACALARAAGLPVATPGTGFEAQSGGHVLAALDPSAAHDATWFGPALRALQRGRLERIELTLSGAQPSHHAIGRWQALRFWR